MLMKIQSLILKSLFQKESLKSWISCSVLLLCGERDKANRKASEKLSGILKNSSFEIIENASHEVNIDNPEKLATLLQNFFMKK